MDWLHPFITLTLCCGIALSLLPEGGLRRTAALVLGLLMTLCWADGIGMLLHWPQLPQSPATALTQTGYTAPQVQEIAALLPNGGE